jgi:adenosylmethionine-8-amino-7-oxononanoate aminotransferase
MLGPPLVATDAEIDEMAELTTTAVEDVNPPAPSQTPVGP